MFVLVQWFRVNIPLTMLHWCLRQARVLAFRAFPCMLDQRLILRLSDWYN